MSVLCFRAQLYDRNSRSGASLQQQQHAQSIQLRINLIITRGDGRNDKPDCKPKEELSAMCGAPPQYSVTEKNGKYVAKVSGLSELGVEDLGKEAGQPRSVSGAPAKSAAEAERLAAARALEALSVKRQVEDLSAAGYAEACLSPHDSPLRRFRAVEDYDGGSGGEEEEHALSFKRGDEIVLTSTSWVRRKQAKNHRQWLCTVAIRSRTDPLPQGFLSIGYPEPPPGFGTIL